jgi:adenine-specific DNA-methyltransferase
MIPQTFTDAHERVKELVEIFKQNESRYLTPGYSEAQARLDFIDKFWIALGWDVNHETQTNPYKQEVKVERGVRTNEWRKRADYAFLASNFRDVLFFVEAKKPNVGLENPLYYFQTIRYGWNGHTPLSVLTDFEELRVLDCRYKPNIHTALSSTVLKYHYTDYIDVAKFRTLYYLFSRESVLKGSIHDFAQGMRKRKASTARGVVSDSPQNIDESFLKELDDYREDLARAFKRKNLELDSDALTEVTQRTLDRLVFMRFLEDKMIETEPLVDDLNKRGDAWGQFISTSRRLDRTYNGIIFKEHHLLDSAKFTVDEKVFEKIASKFAHTNSPYDFNAIPIHVLGSIYERFLGKVILATDKRARVEERPEVRKAGGVYYTPQYVVNYIVSNTVGKLIEDKTPEQIRQMRFADIACGSGSFLLGIYDALLRYHTSYYNRTKRNRTEGRKAGCIETEGGGLRLSLLQKRTILLNNIYGVDLDSQAVEVAQLSLYLKMLDDETIASTFKQLEMREALLPSLANNVLAGNSLIEWDVVEGKLFDTHDERELNPMNFEDKFSQVIKSGGFDAIVGNPPWGATFSESALAYLRKKYKRVVARTVDSYIYFLDRSIQLLTPEGTVGYIVPSTILNQVDAKPVRQLLLSRGLTCLISLGSKIFGPKVLNTSTILVSKKNEDGAFALYDLSKLPLAQREKNLKNSPTTTWLGWKELVERDSHLTFFVNDPRATGLLTRMREKHGALSRILENGIQRGISPDVAGAHVVSASIIKDRQLEPELLKPSISGAQIKRYQDWMVDQFLILTTRDTPIKKFPNILNYLQTFKHLNSCPEVKKGNHPWWALHRPRSSEIFSSPKIIGLTTSKTIELIFDEDQSVHVTDAMYVFQLSNQFDPWVVIAVMQSKLFLFLYRVANQGESRVIPQVKASKLEILPFPDADQLSASVLNDLVRQMRESKRQVRTAQTEKDKIFYEGKSATIERQLNELVYAAYDLTKDEIDLVEMS